MESLPEVAESESPDYNLGAMLFLIKADALVSPAAHGDREEAGVESLQAFEEMLSSHIEALVCFRVVRVCQRYDLVLKKGVVGGQLAVQVQTA